MYVKNKEFKLAVFSRRGHKTKLRKPRFSWAGELEDLHQVIEHIQQKFESAPLFATAFSAGCGVLCRYLGESGSESAFKAAICISRTKNSSWRCFHEEATRQSCENRDSVGLESWKIYTR